ncbi:MAG TPA: hypothetical protein VLX92_15960 [Kofleriaceae bacterium]|nr:hypothetical protein [Kofleriaceae bacterium]
MACTACAASRQALPPARFANAPVVTVVDDRRDVPRAPARRELTPDLYFFDAIFKTRFDHWAEVPPPRRALGVNALDEVPDSTWFTNRIGVRALTPAEVFTGPLTADSPELHKPWTIRAGKTGGTTFGLIITDARGIKYLLKFDAAGQPEVETGTDVIADRLLWAAGYNVPEDQVVYFRPDELVLPPNGPVTREAMDRGFARVEREPDGRIRALASRWIDGTTLGGHPGEGVRHDDPNDRIPHELRRDLRGAYAIYAWIDHVDVQEGNYVDSWVADRADPHRHYVRHYLIDFGKCLGAMAYLNDDLRRSHTYVVDLADIGFTLFTLGTANRTWERRPLITIKGVGLFDATTFDPGRWHPDFPYLPFLTADRFDKFWGAKIVARFTRDQIRAAVLAGRLSDPRAVEYITDTLVARQRETLAYWFARVAPLDRFTIMATADGPSLCFDDLAIGHGIAVPGTTTYAIRRYDFAGRTLGPTTGAAAGLDGHACTPPLALVDPSDHGGYTIVEVATDRPRFHGKTLIHVARDPASGAPRVIGVWRE